MLAARHRSQILGAALLFSTGGAAIKAATLTSWQIACFRSGVAALVLVLFMPAWRSFWHPRCLLVGLAYGTTMILYVTGNKLTTAANVIFLQATAPVYLLFLGPRLLGEKVGGRDLFFTATLGAGMALFFVGTEAPQVTAPAPLAGNLVGALAGLSWALTILGLRWLGRLPGDDRTGSAVVAGNLLACVACLPLAFPVVSGRPADGFVIVYLGAFQIGLAYVWMTRGVRRVPALETALLLLLEPVLSAVWAWLVHGERLGAWSLTGGAVIIASTVGRALGRHGRPK